MKPHNPNIEARRAQAMEIIARHLEIHGACEWKEVIDLFPDVSSATIWRWIAKGKKQFGPESAPAIKRAQKRVVHALEGIRIDRHEEAKAAGVAHIARDLPAAPSPAYLARSGQEGAESLDFALEIKNLYADAQKLRTYSVVADETGDRIKNPQWFERSINSRTRILETAIRTLQELWDLRTMQNFYETVIQEIGAESPDCQKRIMQRLADLNSRTGMTMQMRL